MRQRLDKTTEKFTRIISVRYVEFIRKVKGRITPLTAGHIAVDMDVFSVWTTPAPKKKGPSMVKTVIRQSGCTWTKNAGSSIVGSPCIPPLVRGGS